MKNEEISKNKNKKKDDSDNKLDDLKELFFTHPSQRDKKKKDFTEYSRIDMNLLNKKRERENNDNKDKDKDKDEDKDILKDNNLPNELIELIKKAEDNGPFTAEDFDKYKNYKNLKL